MNVYRWELRLLFAAELVARLLEAPLVRALFAEELVARLLLAPDELGLAWATGAIRASEAKAAISRRKNFMTFSLSYKTGHRQRPVAISFLWFEPHTSIQLPPAQ